MEIIIKKGKNRNTLICRRKDGTQTSVNLDKDIPNHDLAHYVVEKQFKLKKGFYGKIRLGMTIEELSDKEVIRSLDAETWLSEIMARNLQSISSGAVKVEEFIVLVNMEAENNKSIELPEMNIEDVKKMKHQFEELCEEWSMIPESGALELIF